MGKGKRLKNNKTRRFEKAIRRAENEARGVRERETQWTNPLRFQQIEQARNQTLGVQKRLYQMVLRDQLKPVDKILEIGAGRGWMRKHIVPDELKQDWIELDEDTIASKQSPSEKKVAGDIMHIPFPDSSVDAIVDSACLDLPDPKQHDAIVREMRRVLKPGGHVISFQDAMPNQAIWAPEMPQRAESADATYAPDELENNRKMAALAHDRFSKAMADSLRRGGFSIVARQPLFGDGHFPAEKRHGEFAEPFSYYPPEMQKVYREAPGFMYWDGFFQPMNLRPGVEKVVPKGNKVEIFQGRLIVAKKPEKP